MDTVIDLLTRGFLNSLLRWTQEQSLGIMDFLLTLINGLMQSFWDNSIMKTILDFCSWIAVIVFAVSLLTVLMDIAEETSIGSPVQWSAVFSNFMKAFCFMMFSRWLAIWSIDMMQMITRAFKFELQSELVKDSVVKTLTNMFVPAEINVLLVFLFHLIINIASIVFVYQSLKRFSVMFIHIMQAPVHPPYPAR